MDWESITGDDALSNCPILLTRDRRTTRKVLILN